MQAQPCPARALSHALSRTGLYRYFLKKAHDEAELERLRREAGLGGALRTVITKNRNMRGLTVMEVAEAQPYRDPVLDAGHDALLTQRVHKAVARFDEMMRAAKGGQA